MKLSLLAPCAILWIISCGIGQLFPDIRLVDTSGGRNTTTGRLEYRLNSVWHTVCLTQFELEEADAACGALGYLYAKDFGSVTSINLAPGSPGQPVVRLLCSFSSIEACVAVVTECNHTQEVGLTCTNEVTPMRLVSEGGRQITTSPVGVVEVFINGLWGTICSKSFRFVEANAACRQLGYEGASAYSSVSSLQYEPVSSTVPVWLTAVNCGRLFQSFRLSGRVLDNLRLCPHFHFGPTVCNHSTDAIVSCIAPGALRLVVPNRGTNNIRRSGRLEIYWNGVWGRVCSGPLTDLTALVACRQLGFSSVDCSGSLGDVGIAPDNSATPRNVIISDVECTNSPPSLLLCSFVNGSSDCRLNVDDVALSCSTSLSALTSTSSCSLNGGSGGRLVLPITLTCGTVVVIIAAIVYTGLQVYCCGGGRCCSQYGRAPVRHEVTASATVSTSTATSTAIAAPADTRTTRPSGVRHDYLRRNPDRARHQQLRHNGSRQHQVHTPSRRLHNWRHIRTNFQSRECESDNLNSGTENHTSGVPHLQNFSSNHNFQATEQESFFISHFGRPTQIQGHEDGVPLPSSEANIKPEEDAIPTDSILQDVPPPSYENATSYPPAYSKDKDKVPPQEEAPPYSN